MWLKAFLLDVIMDSVKQTLGILSVDNIVPSEFCIDLMYKIKDGLITYEQAILLVKEKHMNNVHDRIYEAFDSGTGGIEVIEQGEWQIEYKDCSLKESIVKFEGKYYSITEQRSGSYYSDYYYDDPIIIEVEPKIETVVITKWVEKK